jgi:hypothetical protein
MESEYAEVKAQYEELKMEVSRLESAVPTSSISSQEDIYETLPYTGKDEAVTNTMEQRYSSFCEAPRRKTFEFAKFVKFFWVKLTFSM